MTRNSSNSFITEIALIVDSRSDKELLARFQAARQLYNACLDEVMERLELMRKSDLYQVAKQLPKREKKLRTEASINLTMNNKEKTTKKIQRHRLFDFLDFVLSLEAVDSLEQLLIYQNIAESRKKVTKTYKISLLGKSVIELLASPQRSGFWIFSKSEPLTFMETDYCYADGPAWVEINENKLLSVFEGAEASIGERDYLQNCLIYYREVFFGKTSN